MVRHDYTCGECGATNEYEHPMMSDPMSCISCGAEGKLEKQISVPNIGGWFEIKSKLY